MWAGVDVLRVVVMIMLCYDKLLDGCIEIFCTPSIYTATPVPLGSEAVLC